MKPAGLVLPRHGGQLRAIAQEFNIDQEKLVDFSASISPYPPPEKVLRRLRNCAADAKFLSAYPDLENEGLKDAISVYAAIPKEAIAVANGMMPILDATLRALDLRRCLVVQPCFSGYARSLEAARVEAIAYSLQPEENFAFSAGRLLESIEKRRCDAVLLANPHSPSGVLTPPEILQQLCQRAASAGVTVLLDEAFIDFEPESSLCSTAPRQGKLVVFRSLTKFFAVPALRVAYAAANAAAAKAIPVCAPEWAIGSLASVAAIELMASLDHCRLVRENNRVQRDALFRSLRELGLRVFPSRGNYLLVRMTDEDSGLAVWRSLVADHGIVSRCCHNFAGLDGSYLRFSVRTKKDNDALVQALKKSLPPDAVRGANPAAD